MLKGAFHGLSIQLRKVSLAFRRETYLRHLIISQQVTPRDISTVPIRLQSSNNIIRFDAISRETPIESRKVVPLYKEPYNPVQSNNDIKTEVIESDASSNAQDKETSKLAPELMSLTKKM